MRRFLNDNIGFIGIGIAILILIFVIVDGAFGKAVPVSVTIVDKQYKAANVGVGVGTTTTSGGGVGTTVVTTSEEEKFLLIAKDAKGEFLTLECSPAQYYSTQVGSTIAAKKIIGLLSGWKYRIEL